MTAYFNTNQASLLEYAQFTKEALTQEDMVLEVMKRLKKAAWFEIRAEIEMNEDSLKRSLSNLKDRGLLAKDTDKANMVMGPHSKRCHRYVLIEQFK